MRYFVLYCGEAVGVAWPCKYCSPMHSWSEVVWNHMRIRSNWKSFNFYVQHSGTPGQSLQVGFKVSGVEAKVQGFAQKQCQVCSRGTKQMQRVCFSQFSKNHNLNCRGLWAKMGKVLKLHLFCSVQVGHPQGLALMSLTKKTEFSS